jgi:hypothetical protein
MFRRGLAAILLVLGGAGASAEPWHDDYEAPRSTLTLGESQWELYRPETCEQELFDLGYLARGLRADKPGFGLRFRSTRTFTFDFRIDPMNDSNDFVGPVYDPHIGATILTFAVNF